jgi:hypothetical protein
MTISLGFCQQPEIRMVWTSIVAYIYTPLTLFPSSESCIKGHRSSSCKHANRPLFEIKKKGRPISQCEKCRELRQSKRVHSKCLCNFADGLNIDSSAAQSSPPRKKSMCYNALNSHVVILRFGITVRYLQRVDLFPLPRRYLTVSQMLYRVMEAVLFLLTLSKEVGDNQRRCSD